MNDYEPESADFYRLCDSVSFFLCSLCIFAISRLKFELPSPQGLFELVQRWLTA